MPRKIRGHKRNELIGDWIKLDEMGKTCSTHGEKTNETKLLLESLKGVDQSEDLVVRGRIILK